MRIPHLGSHRLVALILLGGVSGAAQTTDAQPLIERVLDALGGREAIARLRSLSVEARCGGPGGDFVTRVDSFRPGLTYFKQTADDGEAEIWSNGEATWHRGADGGVEELPGPGRYFVRAHEFHLLLLELESRFSDHRLGAWSEVAGRRCRLIEMTDESGQAAALCVAESDGLPLRLEMNPQGAEGAVRITFDGWRQIGDLWFFSGFTLTEGPERTFTYAYERIDLDTVTADRFVTPAPSHLQEDQDEILAILRDDRRAHLETDAALLASHLAETLVEVSGGAVHPTPRAEVESLFASLFEGASYEMWEDTAPPVIRLSADSTMAWVARSVRVRRRAPGLDGEPVLQAFTSAYTATYERLGGEWRMTSVTSTFLEPGSSPG
jgi:hypothetical protein